MHLGASLVSHLTWSNACKSRNPYGLSSDELVIGHVLQHGLPILIFSEAQHLLPLTFQVFLAFGSILLRKNLLRRFITIILIDDIFLGIVIETKGSLWVSNLTLLEARSGLHCIPSGIHIEVGAVVWRVDGFVIFHGDRLYLYFYNTKNLDLNW